MGIEVSHEYGTITSVKAQWCRDWGYAWRWSDWVNLSYQDPSSNATPNMDNAINVPVGSWKSSDGNIEFALNSDKENGKVLTREEENIRAFKMVLREPVFRDLRLKCPGHIDKMFEDAIYRSFFDLRIPEPERFPVLQQKLEELSKNLRENKGFQILCQRKHEGYSAYEKAY